MTKLEKAINFFQDMQECTYGNLEEVDMAIHALEQERNVIEELEKLKEEIDTLYGVYYSYFKERLVIKTDVVNIIDNHITELKGDKNEQN